MIRIAACAIALAAFPLAAMADEDATAEEISSVQEAIGKIGCEAREVEKETDNLYEVDDAVCAIGQYDIKLDGSFTIMSMTYDGPVDED